MAVKITFKPKNNDTAIWFKCKKCGCEFWADKYDMMPYTKDKSLWAAKCPNCNEFVVGNFSMPWSRIFGIFDKISNWFKQQKETEKKSYYDRFL